MRFEYVCVEPEISENLLYKYYGISRKEIEENPDIFSLEEKKILDEHIKMCKRCEQDGKILRKMDHDLRYFRRLIREQIPDYKQLPLEDVLKRVRVG